jgi:hypothetical protein
VVNFNGGLIDTNGKPLTGVVGVTFSLYKNSEGGAPLWMETQNVQADKTGHYSVMLGSTASQGLPSNLFVSGEARWLGVQAQGETEQPRVLLLSVPYALKALDAETIGGKPASSFMLAPAPGAGSSSSHGPNNLPPLTGTGTPNHITKWLTTTKLGNSGMFETAAGNVGIGTTTPAVKFDVNGAADIRKTLTLFPSGTGNTLAVSGSAFKISSTGNVTFVSGQTFPGTGTITGVTAGSGLTGGGNSGKVTLGLITSCSSGQVLQWNGTKWVCSSVGSGTITGVTAGTDLTGGGTSGNVTLSLDTTKVPQLGSANTFTTSQFVAGSLDVDSAGTNNGASVPGLQFGGGGSGETISSDRTGTFNQFGLDFYTSSARRMSIFNDGVVTIGGIIGEPGGTQVFVFPPAASDTNGNAAIIAVGGETFLTGGGGGDGVSAGGGIGNSSGGFDGNGGTFQGGCCAGSGDGIFAFPGSGLAGLFGGDVAVEGNLSKSGGSFKIDHPLDPANKYLYHSFVESPDMKNIYDGVANLDGNGEAVVEMPDWFGTLNKDFRYQLTSIGAPGPNLYIAEEISGNHFKIAGGKPGARVSWQVTGVRQDAWANAHRIPVEEEKNARERGFYIHPELYGASEERAITWARHPATMKRMKATREQQKNAAPAHKPGSSTVSVNSVSQAR